MSKGTDGMSEMELAILTPEERAALNDETSEEEAQARAATDNDLPKTAIAPAEGGADAVLEPEGDDVPDAVGAQGAAAAGAATEAAAVGGEAAGDREPFTVRLPVEAPVDYDQQLTALNAQFDDGEISQAEYSTKLMQISEARTRAKLAEEMNHEVEKQLWTRAIDDFMDANPQYKKSTALMGALNASIQDIERGSQEDQRLSGPALLREAHKRVMSEFGQRPPAAAKGALASRAGAAPDLSKIPTTLADVPAAEAPDTGKDKWADLDRLADSGDWQGYEAALARLSPAEQKAYAETGVPG